MSNDLKFDQWKRSLNLFFHHVSFETMSLKTKIDSNFCDFPQRGRFLAFSPRVPRRFNASCVLSFVFLIGSVFSNAFRIAGCSQTRLVQPRCSKFSIPSRPVMRHAYVDPSKNMDVFRFSRPPFSNSISKFNFPSFFVWFFLSFPFSFPPFIFQNHLNHALSNHLKTKQK